MMAPIAGSAVSSPTSSCRAAPGRGAYNARGGQMKPISSPGAASAPSPQPPPYPQGPHTIVTTDALTLKARARRPFSAKFRIRRSP